MEISRIEEIMSTENFLWEIFSSLKHDDCLLEFVMKELEGSKEHKEAHDCEDVHLQFEFVRNAMKKSEKYN